MNVLDRVYFSSSTTGTGTTLAIGSAVSALFRTPADAGAVNDRWYKLLIVDGSAWEIARAQYKSATPNFQSRTLVSSSSGSLLNLSGSQTIAIIAASDDLGFRGCRLRISADRTAQNLVGAGSFTWDAEDFDTDGFHSLVSNTELIEIPASKGINYVELTAGFRGSLHTADSWCQAFIRQNSATLITQPMEWGSTNIRVNLSTGPIQVADGDDFDVLLQAESDTSVTLEQQATFFSLKVLG